MSPELLSHPMLHRIEIVVPTPVHSGLGVPLCYRSAAPLPPGTLVRVPLGRREVLGVTWSAEAPPADAALQAEEREIAGALDALPPLSDGWRQLVAFAASYYQRSLGEIALAALPPQLRELQPEQLDRRLKRHEGGNGGASRAASRAGRSEPAPATGSGDPGHLRGDSELAHPRGSSDPARLAGNVGPAPPGGEGNAGPAPAPDPRTAPQPTPEQAATLEQIAGSPGPFLLFGATGSGKTEVYLRAVEAMLAADPQGQALVMVPEINLTPQLQQRFEQRFGTDAVAALHSAMTPAQRLRSWLAGHLQRVRIVLGTRMAIFASLPRLRLIVVDEEHDPSYKQQEGARYSARDLAVYRAKVEGAKVLLGSATPSLESWHAAERGRYRRLEMPSRVGAGVLPRVRLVDMNLQPPKAVFAVQLLEAMKERIRRGEQSLVFLNRRGYAPVLACTACDWKSDCPHCSAFRVFHKIDRTLRCHHCGEASRVPRACPACGNVDIAPVGRGTERLEEQLAELLADTPRPDGSAPRVVRIDADTTRLKGSLESQLAAVHAGAVDVLVGTQMVTKGHDFRRITLVASVNADSALFSGDFRAAERLFALLMQAAGRAGRDASQGEASEMWVQTFQPAHPLFAALKRHDFAAFAAQQLKEREQAAMPPFSYQALLRAEGRTQEIAQAFLLQAQLDAQALPGADAVAIFSPVPMAMQRIANVERAQMLLESGSRPALQRLLAHWQPLLLRNRPRGLLRWAIDVDPLAV